MWKIVIGGSKRAREQWKSGRVYKHKRSARRRLLQVKNARDMGVSTIWLIRG